MHGTMERRTVYAITVVALLTIAGGWVFAATFVDNHPPAQNSTITVVTPNGASEVVQSTQLITLSDALNGQLIAAGQQPGSGNGLNSTYGTNVALDQCTVANCSGNFSAVDATFQTLHQGDSALQVALLVNQTDVAQGFDIQTEVIYQNSTSLATVFAFGSGYFDTNTTQFAGHTLSTISVFLYVDLGTAATFPPIVQNIVVTVNACTSATTCP
ncbi:MAG: hypothetical protein WBF81_00835 [Thermoplasmata archaeon]